MNERLEGIHTNIITGFLGAGKSTAILNLLEKKPTSERWAILVNEFGEVGIDGGLLSSNSNGNVFIREVPGGCMCCTAGLSMQMAMNMLLARSRPDRLIIEPTGLGHPFEVVEVLSSEYYQELLDIRATITLVDARKIRDERYTQHATFNEQMEIADVIVASKSDLYDTGDFENLQSYLRERAWLTGRTLAKITDGELDISWLQEPAIRWQTETKEAEQPDVHEPKHEHRHEHDDHDRQQDHTDETQAFQFPPEGYIRLSNSGEGYASHGWVFKPSITFDREQLQQLLTQTNAERIKALMHTSDGDIAYNFAGDTVEELLLQPLDDSRIEIIADVDFQVEEFEKKLLATSPTV